MGTHPIKYFLLNKNELSYEVLIRGAEPASTVIELKKQIAKLTPSLPSTDILESGLEPADDLSGAAISLKELATRVKQLEEKYDYSLHERSRALCYHIYHRLKRIDDSTPSATAKGVNKDFNDLYNRLATIQRPSTPTPSTSSAGQPFFENTTSPATTIINCDHQLDRIRPKFNGATCVRAFLTDVKEYASVKNITADRLLAQAPLFFTGNAKHWHRSIRDTVKTWDELAKLLLRDFTKKDYDYRLLAEIRSRTQGESEDIIIYFSIMADYFSRLIKPLSEQDKLEILLHNIRPCYANVLAANPDSLNSVEKLRTLCLNYESVHGMTAQYRDPPRVTPNTLAPDLAFEPKSNQNSNKHFNTHKPFGSKFNHNYTKKYYTTKNENNTQPKSVNAVAEVSKPTRLSCPRCRTNDHTLSQCKMERFPICFKCGKQGVKFPDCTDCLAIGKSNSKNKSKN
ncbi:uncharacterized protein LOC123879961 isoform X2 [Maniola jurtina]|uniref:uncharacterized protein LOC123879961 isoform X1 n=1 Tax=Maniola jurtina TaxID=191418 RepID=UPI001E68C99E|nr:uncharacterized protein LOC123879961 isoform X1 [Maniola jurtina]XP_045783771.1 uncharacterized protein LOC123879961 isoform X2 [Maniola jurtina]XP_045783772.1 uncharacterized protein LOC123879961 isoform X2 [Maniola jurtina]